MNELERTILGRHGERPQERIDRQLSHLRVFHIRKGKEAFHGGLSLDNNPWNSEVSPERHALWAQGFNETRNAIMAHG